MKFDYSKTINEQLPTFDYYKDRYCSYELELINDRKEIERLNGALQTHEILLKSNVLEIERLNNIIEYFEEELERDVNIKEENTDLEHNTYIDINSTLKKVLERFRELKGSSKNE